MNKDRDNDLGLIERRPYQKSTSCFPATYIECDACRFRRIDVRFEGGRWIMPIWTRQTTGLDRRVVLAGLEVGAVGAVGQRAGGTRRRIFRSLVTDSRARSLRPALRPTPAGSGDRGREFSLTVPSRPRLVTARAPWFDSLRKFIPVEFSGVAYRFERGVVRPSYWANLRGYPGGNPDSGPPDSLGFVSAMAGPSRPAGGAREAGVGASIGKVRPATNLTWALTPSQLVNVAGW